MSWVWRVFYVGCGFVAGCVFTLGLHWLAGNLA